MLTILGGLLSLWLLLLVLGVVGLIIGLGTMALYAIKGFVVFGVIYLCVRLVCKMLGLL